MDMSKQLQDAIKTWTNSQKKILEDVTKVVTDFTAPPTSNPWETSLDLWEKGVNGFLESQQDWSGLLIRSVDITTNKGETNGEWSQRVEELTKLNIELQHKSWQTWFAVLKQLDPVERAAFINELKPLTETWSDNVHRAIELQEEWLQSAINVIAKETDETAEEAPKKEAAKPKKQPA
jgi:hypothetical protein